MVGQVGIARCSPRVPVPEELPDLVEAEPVCGSSGGGEGAAEVMEAHVPETGTVSDLRPWLLDVGERLIFPSTEEDGRVDLLAAASARGVPPVNSVQPVIILET